MSIFTQSVTQLAAYMQSHSQTSTIYQKHRGNQRERILEAAEKLFIRDGIDGVSISDIAAAARISRKTMYQYFTDKREIAWAIFEKLVSHWGRIETLQPEATGYQQLEQFMAWMVTQLETNREHLRFIVELDALYARETSADRMRQITGRGESGNAIDWVAQMVRKGISDGSVRAEVHPEEVAAALMNLVSGMNARLALLGELITQEYGRSGLAIYQEICRIFLRGLQANQ